ncbi:MAG: efflux transporter outer membrane subunit [Alphaproteobacteria bacterium]|nr:efflux transporter outer membrane subunit [Alphaproteobacteria bacterium]
MICTQGLLRRGCRRRLAAIGALAAVALAAGGGCTAGPDYVRPSAPMSGAYKEPGWQPGVPRDAIDRGAWWSVFGDPILDGLERQIDISNQNLKASEASFRQAEAVVMQARAGYFPTVGLNASAQRSRSGGGGRSGTAVTTGTGAVVTGSGGSGNLGDFFSTSVSASWEPDLWGRIRRTVESGVASAQASAGDLASARLSAQGQLASDYLQLRVADELTRLLEQSVQAYTESVRITRNQFNAGTAAQSDVAQAETQLASTQAQAIAVGVTRAQLEHAIAILIGRPPAELTIAPAEMVIAVPVIPTELPSALLERRPDVAAAERRVAAANATIGVDIAAFYPTITLSADYGVSAAQFGHLFTAASRVWSLGSSLSQTLFDAGARSAAVLQARAAYDATVADYRQTVLTALQQVEDELAATRVLAQQAAAEDAAVAAARQAESIIENQYKAGTVAYTSVIVAQQTALANAETALNLRESRLTAAAALIQALGGGWDVTQLPARDRIESDVPLDFSPLPPPLPAGPPPLSQPSQAGR